MEINSSTLKKEAISGTYLDNDQGDFGLDHKDAINSKLTHELIAITSNLF
ncbi:hypothetical protein [Wenyingzhuangia sp. 2_MG-2023]|nr:hypothetical protein [Wenyingzhuangia sp. 2_MG-2023]MDO6737443.1 hypothetical protein [Wenyingzhuangia sp. 2_MG-2023]MDO6803171.1 hypothetical protein [Wenyingzhuangia sp. 1_MG-2023]